MRWLVDGYNVIRRDPDLAGVEERGLDAARAALLALVAGVARRSGDRFTVVFDGAPGHGPGAVPGQVEVVFSRAPEKADDVLIALARRLRDGAIVVSSDRMVQDAARRAGSTAISAEAFVAAVEARGDARADEVDDDEEHQEPRRGNPRRLSRDERAVRRALGRLRGRPR